MNAEQLLAHYERISEAPDAIARLRNFVLDLAVHGKLTAQLPQDEPASKQLDRILARKAVLGRPERNNRSSPLATPSSQRDAPLPSGWTPTALSNLVAVINGRAYKQHELLDSGTPVLRVGNLFTSDKWYYSNLELDDDKYCDSGDLIFAWSASFGPFVWRGGRVIYHYHIWKLQLFSEEDLSKQYLYNLLLQKTREIKKSGHGISMIHMTKEKMERVSVLLPPLAEQHRIVAKVDELMALCDQLEAARAKREATRDRLTAATLARLSAPNRADSDSPEEPSVQRNAKFALTVFPALTERSNQISQIRRSIANLAIAGRLVSRVADEEHAKFTLAYIAERKRKLYMARAISKPKDIAPLQSEPFPIPSNWAWAQLGELCYQVSDGPHFSPQYVRAEEGVPFLSTRNIRPTGFDLSSVKYVSPSDHEAFCKRIRPEKGDILYTKGGTTGIAKVNDLEFDFSVWVHVAVLRIEKEKLLPRYIEMALNSPHCYEQSQKYTQGTSNSDLGLTRLIKITLPVPPLSEQHRIVAKVDELMAICDKLEAALASADQARSRLLDALLHEALLPATDVAA